MFEGARIPLTASFGVAIWPADGKEPEALLSSSDRAMYAAKQTGRNRVVAAPAFPRLPPGDLDPELPRRSPGGTVDGVDLLARGKQGHLEVVQTLEDGAGTMAVTLR